jgi:hypothetical protein
MDNIENIERQIEALAPEELAQFRAWFLEFDWAAWDRQLEADIQAGKLDRPVQEARRDHAAGKTTPRWFFTPLRSSGPRLVLDREPRGLRQTDRLRLQVATQAAMGRECRYRPITRFGSQSAIAGNMNSSVRQIAIPTMNGSTPIHRSIMVPTWSPAPSETDLRMPWMM